METNDLIQLGELLPMKNAIMSILLPLQAGATISAGIAGSQLLPTVAEQDGEQLMMLGLSGTRLRPNTLIMGQIKIKEGGQQRSLWVSGRVLSQDPAPFQNDVICLRYRDSDLKFFCGSGMELSGERLSMLVPNLQQAFGAGQMLIERTAPNYYALTATNAPPHDAKVDNREITRWSRSLLQAGTMLSVGSARFNVDGTTKPKLELEYDVLDFGTLQSANQTVNLNVRNLTSKALDVELAPTVGWINSISGQIAANDAASIPVQLNSNVMGLAQRTHLEHSALYLVLMQEREVYPVSVKLKVEQLPFAANIEPAVINMGDVFSGSIAGHEAQFQVNNLGGVAWQARLATNVSWLGVEPATVSVPAQGSVTCRVIALAEAENLPEGVAKDVFVSAEGKDATLQARVLLRVKVPPLQIYFQPLHFGGYHRGSSERALNLRIENTGATLFEGTIQTNVDWLYVQPETLRLEPGYYVDVPVYLKAAVERFPDGEVREPQALVIQTGKHLIHVPADVQLLPSAAVLELSTQTMTLPPYRMGGAHPSASVEVRNSGQTAWLGVIQAKVPWLSTEPAGRVRLEAGQTMTVWLHVNNQVDALSAQTYNGTVVIGGMGNTLTLRATLEVLPQSGQAVAQSPVQPAPPPQPAAPPVAQTPPAAPPVMPPTPASKPRSSRPVIPSFFSKPNKPPQSRQLEANIDVIDFGTVRVDGTVPPQSVFLTTEEDGLQVTISSQVAWLMVEPTTLALPQKQPQEVVVSVDVARVPTNGGEFPRVLRVTDAQGATLLELTVRIRIEGSQRNVFFS